MFFSSKLSLHPPSPPLLPIKHIYLQPSEPLGPLLSSTVGWPVNELEKLGDSLVSRFALCSCKRKKYSQFISLFSLRKVRKCWNNQKLVWILPAWLPVLPPDWYFGPDQNYILCCDIFTIVLPSICFIPTLNRFNTIYIGIFTQHLQGLQLQWKIYSKLLFFWKKSSKLYLKG